MTPPPSDLAIFLKRVWGVATVEWGRFLIAAGLGWLFFYVIRARHWTSRKIIAGAPAAGDICREVFFSATTCGIYGIVGVLSWTALRHHRTRMYFNIHSHGWEWFVVSIILTIFVHDTYFYWTHRLMHLRWLFPWMHRMHHRSTNPTPWAAYAFDPVEAFVQAGIFPLVLFLYPIHPLAFLIFMIWQISFNVLGHCGFEIFPPWFLDSWLGKFFNTPTNHAMHHQYFKGNYGLYFNLWDRAMGTNHKNYESRFRQVTAPPRDGGAAVAG